LEWVCGKVDEYTINSEESDFDGDSESVLKNIEKLSRAILECSLVDCYNNNRTDLFKDNDFLYNDILNFDKIDGVTGYNCYNNVLNDTGKKNVREMLLNNNFSNIEELRESFVKLTLYNGIHNDINSGGYGHMEQLFTNANIDYAKLNLPYYKALSDKYKVDSKIVIDNSINLNNFETKIEEYAKAASNGSLGTPGESSNSVPSVIPGAGSSASKSGISVNNINEKNNEVVESVFSDLTDTPWAEEAIISLYEKGILSGTGDGKFNPKQNMTREQAVKIVCEMQQFPESNMNTEFKDVDENSWYADYIKKAVENGIINGISQDEFGVGKNITRQDFVVIVYRALGAEEYKGVFGFSDSSEIADYAKEAVGYFANRGVISGYPDNTFSPNGNITRAEAAKIIYGIINEE